ncbi:MAG: hypothetical protein KDD82_19290 [Planctomycetes bacterium]|nr:hypothetical protein [Planctomycetota bacterium]
MAERWVDVRRHERRHDRLSTLGASGLVFCGIGALAAAALAYRQQAPWWLALALGVACCGSLVLFMRHVERDLPDERLDAVGVLLAGLPPARSVDLYLDLRPYQDWAAEAVPESHDSTGGLPPRQARGQVWLVLCQGQAGLAAAVWEERDGEAVVVQRNLLELRTRGDAPAPDPPGGWTLDHESGLPAGRRLLRLAGAPGETVRLANGGTRVRSTPQPLDADSLRWALTAAFGD